MSLTLAQMASRVLRNVQIPEDSSTAGVQALADAKQYLNERARDVWKRRLWREYLILGTCSVPAATRNIALSDIAPSAGFTTSANGYSAVFFEIAAVREGSVPLMAEDMTAINAVRADLWTNTKTPVRFVNRGQSGIVLMGEYAEATTLSFMGKAAFADIADGETWCLNNENCLIAGATGDMLRDHDRDDQRAASRYQEYESEIAKLIDAAEVQGANQRRIVPAMPWTDFGDQLLIDTSKTGTRLNGYY